VQPRVSKYRRLHFVQPRRNGDDSDSSGEENETEEVDLDQLRQMIPWENGDLFGRW